MAAFGAAISEHPAPADAVGEVVGAVIERVGVTPDLALLFVSGHRPSALGEMAVAVRHGLAPSVLIGATTPAAIGGPLEAEEGPAVSLWAGCVGPVEPVHLRPVVSGRRTVVSGMPAPSTTSGRTLVLLADPAAFPLSSFVAATNSQHPRLTMVGGTVGARGATATHPLVSGDGVATGGAVGALLPAGIGEFAVVTQGCRPIGRPLVVTDADGNLVRGLGSRPALERLRELYDAADDAERTLLGQGLHVGMAVDEHTEHLGPGDFLIRGILDTDEEQGAIRIGDRVTTGTTLQFHVHDPGRARNDMIAACHGVDADAALLFSDTGRGRRLGRSDHDARTVVGAAGEAVAGMFCPEQVGPVGDGNQVYGRGATVLFLYG